MKTEAPSKKYDDLPSRGDSEQADAVERAILRALQSGSRNFWEVSLHARPRNPIINVLTCVASIWVVLFAVLSLLALVVGSVGFGISPFHSLQSIAHEQRQNERETAFTDTRNSLSEYHVKLGDSLLNVE